MSSRATQSGGNEKSTMEPPTKKAKTKPLMSVSICAFRPFGQLCMVTFASVQLAKPMFDLSSIQSSPPAKASQPKAINQSSQPKQSQRKDIKGKGKEKAYSDDLGLL